VYGGAEDGVAIPSIHPNRVFKNVDSVDIEVTAKGQCLQVRVALIHFRRILLALIFVTVAATWLHLRLLDGLDGFILGLFLSEDTRYAEGYSDAAFRRIRKGMTTSQVVSLIGHPIAQSWTYEREGRDPLVMFFNAEERLRHVSGQDHDRDSVPPLGTTSSQVLASLDTPTWIAYRYSESPTDTHYRVRSVIFNKGIVDHTVGQFWWD
jgi:hypothetical protein